MLEITSVPIGADLIRRITIPSGASQNTYRIYRIAKFTASGEAEDPYFVDEADMELLFTGYVYGESGQTVQINIASVLRDFWTKDQHLDFLTTMGLSPSTYKLTVVNDVPFPGQRHPYPFQICDYFAFEVDDTREIIQTWWEYTGMSNKEMGYDVDLHTYEALNDPVQMRIANGMGFNFIFNMKAWDYAFDGQSPNPQTSTLQMEVEYINGDVTTADVQTLVVKSTFAVRGKFNMRSYIPVGRKTDSVKQIRFIFDDSPVSGWYLFDHCLPDDTYVVYYENQRGAVDWIYCTLKSSETIQATRNMMEHQRWDNDRLKFGRESYLTSSYTAYTLNTEILGDEASRKMGQLFLSPKVWIQKPGGQIRSAIITESSLKIKKRENDSIFNYTINIEDSVAYNTIA